MRFDFTKGKTEKYLLSIYMPDGCTDKLYYHYYKEAEKKFEHLTHSGHYEHGTAFSIYDLIKDIRKKYVKI